MLGRSILGQLFFVRFKKGSDAKVLIMHRRVTKNTVCPERVVVHFCRGMFMTGAAHKQLIHVTQM